MWLRRSSMCSLISSGRAKFKGTDAWWFWFFTGCFVVVRLAEFRLDFSLANIIKYLSRAVFEQMEADLILRKHIAYQNHPTPILCVSLCLIPIPHPPHPLVQQLEKILEKKAGLRRLRVWSIQELGSTFISFLLSGLGRVSQKELYFDEPGFTGKQNRAWRGKGLVFGEDGVSQGKGGRRIS